MIRIPAKCIVGTLSKNKVVNIKEEWEKHKASKGSEEQRDVKKFIDIEMQKENVGYSNIGYVTLMNVSPENLINPNKEVVRIIQEYENKEDLARKIFEVQPYFYDTAGIFWKWDKQDLYWKKVDDTDILNLVSDKSNANTISSKNKCEILEAMKQYGRRVCPKPIEPLWIQFKDIIFDLKDGVQRNVSYEYFVTNPIPYRLDKENFIETPAMDKIFTEWVGEEHLKTLYQIIAYCLIPSYPINRIFCLIGGGLNGKSKFLELLTKFLGERNCATTELDTLINSRFELTRLHKKLMCQIGETNFNEISRTSILKKLTGGDLIPFEYKKKDLTQDKNYAKIIISTNNLPTTTDKTIGFYRRWLIIDFPNQFNEKKDILMDIPEEEYSYLANKCCWILKDLLDNRQFYNEGSIEDRMKRYEEKSNFLGKFLEQFTERSEPDYITSADFYKKFSDWSKENRYRQLSETSFALALKEMGIEKGKRYFNWLYDGKGGQARVWEGIKWKD